MGDTLQKPSSFRSLPHLLYTYLSFHSIYFSYFSSVLFIFTAVGTYVYYLLTQWIILVMQAQYLLLLEHGENNKFRAVVWKILHSEEPPVPHTGRGHLNLIFRPLA